LRPRDQGPAAPGQPLLPRCQPVRSTAALCGQRPAARQGGQGAFPPGGGGLLRTHPVERVLVRRGGGRGGGGAVGGGGGRRRRGVVRGVGHGYKAGVGLVAVRWVYVHDLTGTHRDEYFYSTDVTMSPQEILERYTERWNIETTFQELRAYLGLETTRGWCAPTV